MTDIIKTKLWKDFMGMPPTRLKAIFFSDCTCFVSLPTYTDTPTSQWDPWKGSIKNISRLLFLAALLKRDKLFTERGFTLWKRELQSWMCGQDKEVLVGCGQPAERARLEGPWVQPMGFLDSSWRNYLERKQQGPELWRCGVNSKGRRWLWL